MMTKQSTIAKLLSEENITVTHRKANTASFNVETRELILPIFKDEISNDLYDMFTCHEVGHALYTPMDLLMRGKHQGINHSVINVLEDARIEKKFQEKYPGSVKNFKQGYKELIEGDFFKLKDKDLSKLNIIDKINVFYKTGLIGDVNEVEQKFIDEVDTLKTVEDVISLAARLCKYHKEQQEQNQNGEGQQEEQSTEQQEGEGEGQGSGSDDQDKQDTQESQESEEMDEGSGESDDGEEKSEESNDVGTQGAGSNQDGDLKSSTDKAYQDAMNKNNDHEAKDRFYTKLPKKVNMSKLIMSHKQIQEELVELYSSKHTDDFKQKIDKEYKKIYDDNKKVVQYMVKEFEMKKSADQYKRASISKTGTLDMTKLHNYKFDEDLFAKMTTLPGSTNHGMIMYLDYSGSMADNMRFTLIQLFNLIWFCQRVKIPYQVLAFTDRMENKVEEIQDERVGDHCFKHFKLLEFFSNKQTKQETQQMMTDLIGFTMYWDGDDSYTYDKYASTYVYPTYVPRKFNLGGTPLNTAILTGYKVAKTFQENNKVQKLNMIFLTDGDSHHHESIMSEVSPQWWRDENTPRVQHGLSHRDYGKDIFIQCEHTKVQTQIKTYDTDSFLKFLKLQLPNVSLTGFFIAGRGKLGRVSIRDICVKYNLSEYSDKEKIIKIQKELREKKVAICKVAGYDEYYILPRGPKQEEEEQELTFKKNAKTAGMAREFLKFAQKKTLNRQLLNKFIEKVA